MKKHTKKPHFLVRQREKEGVTHYHIYEKVIIVGPGMILCVHNDEVYYYRGTRKFVHPLN